MFDHGLLWLVSNWLWANIAIFRAARNRRPLRLPRLFDSEDSGDVPDGAFA